MSSRSSRRSSPSKNLGAPGAVEVVAVAPRYGSLLVAGWLGGIIVNLVLAGGYGDIALRDFGLMLGALTLARLAWSEEGSTSRAHSRVFHSGTGASTPAAGT